MNPGDRIEQHLQNAAPIAGTVRGRDGAMITVDWGNGSFSRETVTDPTLTRLGEPCTLPWCGRCPR